MAEIEYRRVPGRGSRRGNWFAGSRVISYLYQGPDHLLLINRTGFEEEYRRFYFSDIQSIVLRRTRDALIGNVTCFALGLPMLGFGVSVSDVAGRITLLVLAGICLALGLLNLALGPTCICHMRTAVQIEELPSIRRLRKGRKFLQMVSPWIGQVQGTLTAEELSAKMQEAATDPGLRQAPAGVGEVKAIKRESGWVHQGMFLSVLVEGLLSLIEFGWPGDVLNGLELLSVFAVVGFGLAAIVRQINSDLPRAVRRLTIAVMVLQVFFLFAGIIYVVASSASEARPTQTAMDIRQHPFLFGLTALTVAFGFTTGGVGLVWVRRFRRERLAAPPVISEVPPAAGKDVVS